MAATITATEVLRRREELGKRLDALLDTPVKRITFFLEVQDYINRQWGADRARFEAMS